MKEKHGYINQFSKQIIEMREAGRTRQEIADELGLTKEQIKEWVKRYNRRIARTGTSIPKQQGRPRTRPLITDEEKDKEIKRLKMENELLRDFLRLCGRR